jgi:hypothetical protein
MELKGVVCGKEWEMELRGVKSGKERGVASQWRGRKRND